MISTEAPWRGHPAQRLSSDEILSRTVKTSSRSDVLTLMNHSALREQGVKLGLNRVLVSDESVSVNEAHEQPESSNGTNDAECLLLGTGTPKHAH